MALLFKVGVVKLLPLLKLLPPTESAYQLMIPPLQPVAFKTNVPGSQRKAPFEEGEPGNGLMVAITEVLSLSQLFTPQLT
jgi:hypothetical protein